MVSRHANPPSLELLKILAQVAAANPGMWGESEDTPAPVKPVIHAPPRPVVHDAGPTPGRPAGEAGSDAADPAQADDMHPVPSSR
jgi:hypothetical protein